ncbi:MAG: cation:proton antiporter [Rhodocyclaceae bacterium]|nr:cation:proton antiporter [Rhodocyclaceae bacterium]
MYQNLLIWVLLLTAAVVTVSLARRFKVPTLLAYLAIGGILGPHGVHLLAESHEVETFAEFGVVFLMFSIGLEFSLTRLKAMRSLVFGFGGAQVALTTLGTLVVTWFVYEQGWRAGVAVGLSVAMSSTAIVAKMLSDRFDLHSRSGRQTMGTLLFQDIAVIPSLILLPALAQPDESLWLPLIKAMLEVTLVLIVMFWVGSRFLRRIYDFVARYRSDELFVLTTLWIVVGLSWITGRAGLSLALGAFAGGMLVSETVYRHQVEADIRPFRDILLGLFFVTVGMQLNPAFILDNFTHLMAVLLFLTIGKGLVVLLISGVAKNGIDVALRTAAQLAQAGEFGLILIGFSFSLGLITENVFQITLSAMLISMFIAPFLIEGVARFSGQMAKSDWTHKAKAIHDIAVGSFGMQGHVILCGYGRTGQLIGEFLDAEHIPFIALDIDPHQVKRVCPEGCRVLFGHADRSEVLKAAGLLRARAVVIAYPDIQSAERVVRVVRQFCQDIPIVVRAPDDSGLARLRQAGATEVIPEVLEGSLMIAAETLAQLGVPVERAVAQVRSVRAKRYASLREFYRNA